MDRMTFLNGDDMWCVTNDNCFEEQSENYCGPAIKKLAAYEDTGLTPEEVNDMAENCETRLLTWFEAKYGFPVGRLMGLCEAEVDRASFDNFGKTVFLTREEAEAALKEEQPK